MTNNSFLKTLLLGALLFFGWLPSLMYGQQVNKINGISLVALRDSITPAHTLALQEEYAASHAAVIPYGFLKNLQDSEIKFNLEWQWWGEREQGVRQTIRYFHNQGTAVMLKPQLWIGRGHYTGTLAYENPTQWEAFERSYKEFILFFARIATQEQVALFCIGTELDSFTAQRPEFWQELIQEIRAIYPGNITYAANWDDYQKVPFWPDVDYIGVDAYFPISDQYLPTAAESLQQWEQWKGDLLTLSRKRNKPILFTEYGYISAQYAGKQPWKNATEDQEVSEEAQARLLGYLYQSVWEEPWFAGGFLWKHHPEHRGKGYEKLFTTQYKKAQPLIKAVYLSH